VQQETACQEQSTSIRALLNQLVPPIKNASRVVNETLVAGAAPLTRAVGECGNKRPVHQEIDEVQRLPNLRLRPARQYLKRVTAVDHGVQASPLKLAEKNGETYGLKEVG